MCMGAHGKTDAIKFPGTTPGEISRAEVQSGVPQAFMETAAMLRQAPLSPQNAVWPIEKRKLLGRASSPHFFLSVLISFPRSNQDL